VFFSGGTGRAIGTETVSSKIQHVSQAMKEDMDTGTIELVSTTPDNLPFINNMFDVVLTVNDFFIWEDIPKALREVYRVLRPSCLFLSCIQPQGTVSTSRMRVQQLGEKHVDLTLPMYMQLLCENGFIKVRVEEHRNATLGYKYHLIQAYTNK